jgi:hypothetical protein
MRRQRIVAGGDGMGEIIALRPKARAAASLPPAPGGAQILFFLGVRYVREDTATKRSPRGRGKREKRVTA